ncbi:Hypp935 [Branchiostoma lanceolatum]|uniref:Hypp935 protein n=1 Tax=Branchiostoma lanceolatum TaxID=7740 RepID=A0A8J9ZDD8_BRALA|nr:Hypp935 [Branchiostoma lanceolatum]
MAAGRHDVLQDMSQPSTRQKKRKREGDGDQLPVKKKALQNEGTLVKGVRKYFIFIKKRVSSDWKDLSVYLGLDQADINNIVSRNRDDTSCCMDVLEEWFKRNGDKATIEVLMKALSDAKLQSTVDGLKNNYPELRDADLPAHLYLSLEQQPPAGVQNVTDRILEVERTMFTPEVLRDPARYREVRKLFLQHKALLKRAISGSFILLLTFLRQTDVDRFYHNHYRVGEGTLSQQLSHILISDELQNKVKGAQLIVRLHVKPEDYVRVRERLGQENLIGDNDDERLEYILQLLESTEYFTREYFREDIDAYKVEVENEENLQQDHVTIDLVGRDDDVNALLDKINADQMEHVKVVSITGLGGVGKTTFAHHACARQEREEIFFDLREVTSVKNVHLKIMREFGYPLMDCEPEMVYTTIRRYREQEAVMILDHADGLLEKRETREEFLKTLANFEKQRNNQVQIFVTSRVHLISYELESPFTNLILSQLDVLREGGPELVRSLAGRDVISPDDAKVLADRCVNWPIAIKIVCSLLRDGTVKPGDMLNRLKTIQNITEIREYMLQAYHSLPRRLQHVLLQISVFAGSFTEEAAEKVLERDRKVGFLLWELKMRNLISVSPGGPLRYDMHDLLRTFLSSLRVNKNFRVGEIVEEAEYRYKMYYEARMRDISRTMEFDMQTALNEYEKDSANFTYLHLVLGETADVRERLWNQLPRSVKEAPSLSTFKNLCKTHLLTRQRHQAHRRHGPRLENTLAARSRMNQ